MKGPGGTADEKRMFDIPGLFGAQRAIDRNLGMPVKQQHRKGKDPKKYDRARDCGVIEEGPLHWLTFFPSRRRNTHVMRRGSRRGSQVPGFCRHSKIFRPRLCCSPARDHRISKAFRACHPVVNGAMVRQWATHYLQHP
ncbi:MAG: hypothetical protein LBF49_00460 [Puniceicoccales bacterium]|nr:hypothetical protein [Puniceicoccales bacterium]